MKNSTVFVAVALLSILALGSGLIFYAALPDPMVSHWNALGEADGYMSKLITVLFLPVLLIVTASVLMYIPRVDPLKRNIDSFRPAYNSFIVLFTAVIAVIQVAVIAVNLGFNFNIGVVVMPAVGVLFFAIGVVLPRTKRNWFIGIRTPWTVSSDEVWERTHKLGGTIFKVLGVVACVSVLAPTYALYIFLVPVLVAVFGLILYSYVEYRQLGIKA